MNRTLFVNQLPQEVQERIEEDLQTHLQLEFLLKGEELQEVLEDGMNSRLCDLENILVLDDYEEFIN